MKPLFSDTPPEVERVLIEGYRAMTPRQLYWYQLGAGVSDRQWNDVLGVMKTQGGQLDMPYLMHTAALLNVEDLFQQACQDAGLAGEDD